MKNQSAVKRFQKVGNKFKDHHRTEGYYLEEVFDIYLPFWECVQNVVIEKDMEMDRFSRIILDLVNSGYVSHNEICGFLGVKDDSFVCIQFHYLLKNDLIRERPGQNYEITYEGLSFLDNTSQSRNMGNMNFEYFMTEKMYYLKNDMTRDFFDADLPIDTELSKGKMKEFSGYKMMQTDRIKKEKSAKTIEHNKLKPNFRSVASKRSDFAAFFNSRFHNKNFYDFGEPELRAHKRNICFTGLLYLDDDGNKLMDIRQSEKSVKGFRGNYERENLLSDYVTGYIQKNRL